MGTFRFTLWDVRGACTKKSNETSLRYDSLSWIKEEHGITQERFVAINVTFNVSLSLSAGSRRA